MPKPASMSLICGKKFLKMKNFSDQENVREFHFQSGKFRKKMDKSRGKVREFQKIKKKSC